MQYLSLASAIAFALIPQISTAAPGDATVVLMRGSAKTDTGKSLNLKDVIRPGTTVVTSAKSFVKLLFSDQTQMSIGPDTTLKLEPTKAGEPSLVNLVGGQIRAKVTKDLLNNPSGGSQDKMQVKTKSAAMGIRGTDFNVTFNTQNSVTALVTFEGQVAMVRSMSNLSPSDALSQRDQVQTVGAGQFSGANPDQPQASIPVKISPSQLETLKTNDTFQGLGESASSKGESLASPIPPGVDPKGFSSDTTFGASEPSTSSAGGPPPEGFFDAQSGAYAPRAGGFIDLNSGLYVPPPPGSSFDPNTGVFVPPAAMGGVDPATGMYVPPKGVALDPVKGFVAQATSPGTTPAAPPAALTATLAAMNYATNPAVAGSTVTTVALFGPQIGNAPPPKLPPPPGSLPPPSNLPPPPKEPISDPTCTFCQKDNVVAPPTSTNVNFSIQVQ